MAPEPRTASLRLGFAGTSEFAATILRALLDAGRRPVVVYTQPDRAAGRGRREQPPPVKVLATRHGLPVRQPPSLRPPGEADALAAWRLDVLVVAAYGLLLPRAILAVPRLGCLNVHASLLPRWRGAAPVERAIMAGDAETGVSIMQMDAGLDTGPVYLQKRCPIAPDMDGAALEDRLARLGGQALLACLTQLGDLAPVAQADTGATYAAKLGRADSLVDWSRPARDLERQVRALRERAPAFAELAPPSGTGPARRIRVILLDASVMETSHPAAPGTVLAAGPAGIAVACGADALNVTRLKLDPGKGRPLTARDAVNGYPRLFAVGSVLPPPEPT